MQYGTTNKVTLLLMISHLTAHLHFFTKFYQNNRHTICSTPRTCTFISKKFNMSSKKHKVLYIIQSQTQYIDRNYFVIKQLAE